MKNYIYSLFFLFSFFFCLYSQIPQTLSYQGVLKDAGGTLVPNGTYQLSFNLYTSSSGGTSLWTETQMVPVADGIFNVIIGAVTPFTIAFDVPYWLGITVGTTGELTPRIRLTASAYSLNARSVVDNSVTTSKIQDGAVTQAKLAPGVSLPPGGTAGGDLTGTYPNPTIANSVVTSAKLADGAVAAADLATNAVTTVKVNDLAVTTAKIADGAVTLPKISSSGASSGNVLTYNGSNLVWQTPASGGIGGSGTANVLPVFVTSNTLGNSNVYYSGGFTGIGASPENYDSRLLVRTNLQFGVTPPTYLARFMLRSESFPFIYTDQAYIKTNGDGYFLGKLQVGESSNPDTLATIYCENGSSSGRGVYGRATATSGLNYGGYFVTASTEGKGVYGQAAAASSLNYGGYFVTSSHDGIGVYGRAMRLSGSTYGVYGSVSSADGYGVFSYGRFAATGTKSFQIDHPLNPEYQYLNHYCTEGPEPLNVYRGNVFLDARGEAWIDLPTYFEMINKDWSYTLTAVGASMPGLYVAEEIKSNQFKIAGGEPYKKVSWRVEAVRNDRWVERYGAPVEIDKPEHQRGKYLNPELYGQPESMGVFYEPERKVE